MIGYVTLEEAKTFLGKRYPLDDVDDVSLSQALYLAADKIEWLPIRNSGRNKKQELIFPRLCEKAVPEDVKKAQMLEGYSLCTGDIEALQDQDSGVGSRSINDMSVSYTGQDSTKVGAVSFANAQARGILSRYVRRTYDWA